MLPPTRASLRGRIGAHALHATRDPRGTTATAREAAFNRFLVAVDPDHELPEVERRHRAEHARASTWRGWR